MEFDDIEKILALVREHELAEFELERDGLKIRVRKAHAATAPIVTYAPAAPAGSAPAAAGGDAAEMELAVVKSPIVGTFYRSPEPGAPSFVEVGQRVKKDQVLCIIEAMKLMNEIESEFDGVIEKAYVENGQPVQFNDRLFAIRKA